MSSEVMPGPTTLDKIQDRMVDLGIPVDLVNSYVQLLGAGPCKVAQLAKAMEVSRPEAYRRLERLSDEGFATATLGRPVRYAAASPQEVFDVLEERHVRRLAALKDARRDLEPPLRALARQVSPPNGSNRFRIIHGRTNAHDTLHRLLNEAKQEAWVVNTHEAAAELKHSAGLVATMRRRAEEGLGLRLAVRDNGSVHDRLLALSRLPKADVRILDMERLFRFTLVDQKHLVLFAYPDPSPMVRADGEVALLTEASGLIEAQSALFECLWSTARHLPAEAA